MIYSFSEKIFEEGKRHFVKIPFNVWEECGQKGLIPVKVFIQDLFFECKLVPKGMGIYYIPISKSITNQISNSNEIRIFFGLIRGLTCINHDSPYTLENPIRKIDSIRDVTYRKDGYCGQICIAMLTGLSVICTNLMKNRTIAVLFSFSFFPPHSMFAWFDTSFLASQISPPETENCKYTDT